MADEQPDQFDSGILAPVFSLKSMNDAKDIESSSLRDDPSRMFLRIHSLAHEIEGFLGIMWFY